MEHGQRLRADLAQEPFLRTSRCPCADAGFMEAVSLWAVLRLSGIEAPSRLADELARVIRHGIPEGVPVERGLRCIRAAHGQLTRALFQFCEATLPPGEQLPTVRTNSAELFDGIETLAALVAEEFAAERDHWFAGSAGERAELVNASLNGNPIDPRLALRQLGYDLTLHHVALVVWRSELPATAELLHIARNTVVYRVNKAEQLLGRSVREDRLHLHTALYLADHLGPGSQS